MNEVSIIINGVRYDAVEGRDPECCPECELPKIYCGCCVTLNNQVFKKSDKKFER